MNGQRGAKKHRLTQPSDINQKKEVPVKDSEKGPGMKTQDLSVTKRDHKSWDLRLTFCSSLILGKITRRSGGQLGKFCNNQGILSFQSFFLILHSRSETYQ